MQRHDIAGSQRARRGMMRKDSLRVVTRECSHGCAQPSATDTAGPSVCGCAPLHTGSRERQLRILLQSFPPGLGGAPAKSEEWQPLSLHTETIRLIDSISSFSDHPLTGFS